MGTRLNADRAGQWVPAELRPLVMIRCHGLCEKCGRPLSEQRFPEPALHHRLERVHGGLWTPENVMLCHGACHNLHPLSIHGSPALSYDAGWLLKSYQDPATEPCLIDGRRVLLTAYFTYEEVAA